MRASFIFICFAMLVAAAAPLNAEQRQKAALTARPNPTIAANLPVGKTSLSNGAVVYRPAGAGGTAPPLLVLLHGAGGDPNRILSGFVPEADREGFILLALKSTDVTWDLMSRQNLAPGVASRIEPSLGYGPDVPRIDAALAELFGKVAIDPRRVTLGGFSDGASYALSLGLANPGLFTRIIALSPGFMVPPGKLDTRQRIFIAHGKSDRILPFTSTEKGIVEPLRARGFKIEFHPFQGDHQVDRSIIAAAAAFARS